MVRDGNALAFWSFLNFLQKFMPAEPFPVLLVTPSVSCIPLASGDQHEAALAVLGETRWLEAQAGLPPQLHAEAMARPVTQVLG